MNNQTTDGCPNCKEKTEPCACIRNKCNKCGNPVRNITFTACDDCWDDTLPNEGDTVLDCCMGSGTTGVSCKKNNRHFIGIEKEKSFYDVAVNRVTACSG